MKQMKLIKNITTALFAKKRFVALTLFVHIDKLDEAEVLDWDRALRICEINSVEGRIGYGYVHPIGWSYEGPIAQDGCW